MLNKVTRIAWLYDFYGQLLTEKQQMLIELYYHQDFSLSEIAAEYGVSRQAVHDLLKRAETILEEYENSLGFFRKYLSQMQVVEQISRMVSQAFTEDEKAEQILALLDEIVKVYQDS